MSWSSVLFFQSQPHLLRQRGSHSGGVARLRYDPNTASLVTVGGDHSVSTTTAPVPMDKLLSHVTHYQTQIVSQLRNAVVETGKAVRAGEVKNAYDVEYEGALSLALQPKVFLPVIVIEMTLAISVLRFSGESIRTRMRPSAPRRHRNFRSGGAILQGIILNLSINLMHDDQPLLAR